MVRLSLVCNPVWPLTRNTQNCTDVSSGVSFWISIATNYGFIYIFLFLGTSIYIILPYFPILLITMPLCSPPARYSFFSLCSLLLSAWRSTTSTVDVGVLDFVIKTTLSTSKNKKKVTHVCKIIIVVRRMKCFECCWVFTYLHYNCFRLVDDLKKVIFVGFGEIKKNIVIITWNTFEFTSICYIIIFIILKIIAKQTSNSKDFIIYVI